MTVKDEPCNLSSIDLNSVFKPMFLNFLGSCTSPVKVGNLSCLSGLIFPCLLATFLAGLQIPADLPYSFLLRAAGTLIFFSLFYFKSAFH